MTEDRAVNVVNTRDAATPTGLFDDYGPFVILAVLAVGAGFVFFGKKKKETC
jgi:LPXTG-motif cell wall-anchored protein